MIMTSSFMHTLWLTAIVSILILSDIFISYLPYTNTVKLLNLLKLIPPYFSITSYLSRMAMI